MNLHRILKYVVFTACTLTSLLAAAHTIQLKTALDHTILPADQKSLAYIKVGLQGVTSESKNQRAPVNLAIVLDRSGSMSGQKIEHAKQAAIRALEHLNAQDIVAIVAYDTTVEVIVPATKASDKERIISAIQRLQPRESTALYAGVTQGAAEVRKFKDEKFVNRIILLSDGLANVGESEPDVLGKLGQSLGKESISVTTLGLGLGYNEDLMTQLASKSSGNHAFVENATDLVKIFNQEFGDVLSVVAQKVEVNIVCAENIRPIRVLGRDAEIHGQRVTTSLNQLYAAQEKYILLEIEVPATAVDIRRDIAQVNVSYLDMTSQKTEHLDEMLSLRFSADQHAVDEATHKEVMIAVTEQLALERNKEAIRLRDSGKVQEAQTILQENARYLDKEAAKYDSDQLRKQKESNEQSQRAMEKSDSWQRERKKMREEGNAISNQQSW